MGKTVLLMRENEERMKFLGYNTNISRLILFTFTGAVAGLAGAFYTLHFQFVSISAISVDMTTAVLLMAFVGGTKTFWGPILGAFVYIILQNYLSDITDRWPLFMGFIFVFMVLFIPGGLSEVILNLSSGSFGKDGNGGNPPRRGSDIMSDYLHIQDIHKDFSGLKVLTGVDFKVTEKERHAVIGPNGAGKTTLFNIISGKFKPSSGAILFKGQDISGKPAHVLNRLGLSRSFQITNVFQELGVFDNILSGVRSRHGLRYHFFKRPDHDREHRGKTEAIIEEVGLTDVKDKPASFLSYGQQRALEIGITLSTEPELILLDEPTAGMTREETEHAIRMIDQVTAGRTLIIIEHDMEVVFSLADTISVLHYGTILVSDTPEKIRNDQRVKDAYLGEG